MKRINTLVLGIVTASLAGMLVGPAEATITDPNWVLDRVIIAERGGSSVDVIGLDPSGSIDWSNNFTPPLIYGTGFSTAAMNDGRLFVADTEPFHRILEYNPNDGAFVATITQNQNIVNQPAHLSFGPDGSMYIANAHSGLRVVRMDAGGTYTIPFTLDDLGDLSLGAVIGPDGNLYVSRHQNPPAIVTYQGPGGASPGTNIGFFGFPHDGSELPKNSGQPDFWQDRLYVNGQDGIYKFSADLSSVTKWTSGDGAEIGGAFSREFEFGLDGYVYQAYSNGKVLRYDNESGVFDSVFSSGHENIGGLTLQSHVIPEPATALLIGTGVLMLSAMRRRIR